MRQFVESFAGSVMNLVLVAWISGGAFALGVMILVRDADTWSHAVCGVVMIVAGIVAPGYCLNLWWRSLLDDQEEG